MALDFPNGQPNGTVWTDPNTGTQWVYDSSTNSWTSKGLVNDKGGITYKGSVDITATPPSPVESGDMYSVEATGTANAGYSGLAGETVNSGSLILYDGAAWVRIDVSSYWTKVGDHLEPIDSGDDVEIGGGNIVLGSAGTASFDGPVGIGTDTPAEKLTVSDDAARGIRSHCPNIQATDTNKGLRVTNGSDTNTFSVSYKGEGYFAGNLGIGIDTPTNGRLVVNGPPVNGVPAINLANYNSDVATTSDITLTNNAVVSSKFNLNFNSVTGSITFNRNGDNRTGLNGTAESARFDSAGRLLIGTTSNNPVYGASSSLQIVGNNFSTSSLTCVITGDSTNDSCGIYLGRKRSTNSVANGDQIGLIAFAGHDGTDLNTPAASIRAFVDGTPGADDMPGRLVFSTTAKGASTPTERMRIDKDGRIGLNGTVNNARFYFGGDTAYSSDVGAIGYQNAATISSNTTGTYQAFNTYNAVSATTDLSKCVGYGANFESIKPGGKLADLIGFRAGSSLTAATNNYGFYGNLASGTGRWNFYANGTAKNYFAGDVLIGSATAVQPSSTTTSGFTFRGLGAVANMSRADNPVLILQRTGSDGEIQQFYRQNTQVGNISVTDTATAFNTSSDYRLKENITSIVDASDRVKALKPCRFNFKADADKTVDGFIAHEAQEVVPESVTGTKDATEAIGTLFDWDGKVREEDVTEPAELTYSEEVIDDPGQEGKEAVYSEPELIQEYQPAVYSEPVLIQEYQPAVYGEPELIKEATEDEDAVYGEPVLITPEVQEQWSEPELITPEVPEQWSESELISPAVEHRDPTYKTVTREMTWEKTGDRDAMQGIDQSKLVPLLTAALQEALARIEVLESKLA